jgi:hypothetical protein
LRNFAQSVVQSTKPGPELNSKAQRSLASREGFATISLTLESRP